MLVTARDIITLWVARMVLTGLYNMGDVPFHHVCVHPNLQDGFGQKMSKSKGNGVDPSDLIDKYGTDAVRFTIASFAGETQDVRLPISYECPHCEELVEAKLYKVDTASVIVPHTLKGKFPDPGGPAEAGAGLPQVQNRKPVLHAAVRCRRQPADCAGGQRAVRVRPEVLQQALERLPVCAY